MTVLLERITSVADHLGLPIALGLTRLPAWANGLPLDADGYECGFYMKD